MRERRGWPALTIRAPRSCDGPLPAAQPAHQFGSATHSQLPTGRKALKTPEHCATGAMRIVFGDTSSREPICGETRTHRAGRR